MAQNPEWRGSLSGWKATVDRWVTGSNPQDPPLRDIFFDLAIAYGATALADEIWRYAYDSGAHQLRDGLKSLRGIETMVRDMIFAAPRGH